MTPRQFLLSTALPKSEARLLLQYVCQCSAAELICRDQDALDGLQTASLHDLAARRSAGEPMAYLLGSREFYGRLFRTSPAVLIPRPETEHLVEAVLEKLPPQGRVWDLGTGSGALAVTLACERSDAAVFASDVSEAALEVARENARLLGAAAAFGCGSWFDVGRPPEFQGGYDVIVSNPPYIEAGDPHLQQGDLRFEPQNALTDFADGLSCIRTLAAQAAAHLKPQGWLMVEHGYNQGTAVRQIFAANGWQNVETRRDLAGLERLTIGCKAANGGSAA